MYNYEECLWITDKRGVYLEAWTPKEKETVYSLVPVRAGGDGKVYMEWALFSKWDPKAKAKMQDVKERPVKVYLGTREEVIISF